MAKQHAIAEAQAELVRMGIEAVVADVQRAGHDEAVIITQDGRRIAVEGYVAAKLRKMLKTRYGAVWTPKRAR